MHQEQLVQHYSNNWKSDCNIYLWDKGPIDKLPVDFRILEFGPHKDRDLWTYATCCMSAVNSIDPVELHIFSENKDMGLVELLTTVAYFHHTSQPLNLHHTVNFGKPWQAQSKCEYGLISLPYLDGPALENLLTNEGTLIKCYWLIPITQEEVNFKMDNGIDSLERVFESNEFQFANPNRGSLV